MSKVFCERYHHPGLEGFLLRSGLDIDLEWDCPSLSGSSRKHHSSFNYALQSPRNEEHLHAFYLKTRMEVAWMVQVIEEPLVLPMILLTSKTCHHFLPKFLYTKTSPALCCSINQAGLELEENVL